MLNFIWGGMIAVSILYSFFAGTSNEVTDALFKGAQGGVELVLSLTGMLCFWSGMMEIAEKAGITAMLAKLFAPVLKRIFKDIDPDSKAFHFISMNISANLLGLGNAATPLGISAMKEMQRKNPDRTAAGNSMVLFIVMNTASLQIIPTTLLTLRSNYGSSDPYSVLPCIWISSLGALLCGIFLAALLNAKTTRLKLSSAEE